MEFSYGIGDGSDVCPPLGNGHDARRRAGITGGLGKTGQQVGYGQKELEA
jgi:hypothetical protein